MYVYVWIAKDSEGYRVVYIEDDERVLKSMTGQVYPSKRAIRKEIRRLAKEPVEIDWDD